LVSSSFSFDLLVQMLHCNLYLLIYFVNLTSNIRLIGSKLGNDHLIVKGWLCYSPPSSPRPYFFHRLQNPHFVYMEYQYFSTNFSKNSDRNCTVRSFMFCIF
jgi:hypothetical protein